MNLNLSIIRQASINYINQSSTARERADRISRTRVILDYLHHRQLRQTLKRNGGFWGKIGLKLSSRIFVQPIDKPERLG